MTDADLGTIERVEDRYVVRYERRLRHPRAKVWRAITESEHVVQWLPCDIVGERCQGAAIELPFSPAHVERYDIADPVTHGTITVWDPPSVFEFTWDTDLLRFELVDDGDGTLLRFSTWLVSEQYPAHRTAAGYHACLDNLAELLDTGSASPLVEVDDDVRELEDRYRELAASATSG